MRPLPSLFLLALLSAPSAAQALQPSVGLVQESQTAVVDATRPNVLLIVPDDLGTDRVGAYGEHPDPGKTPVLDTIAARGILFRNAWSNPTCSPTRATLLTGTYAMRNGVGRAITYAGSTMELAVQEPSIPRALPPAYATAAVGKWHLSTSTGSGTAHAQLMGFDHHWGPMDNIDDFSAYPKNTDTRESISTEYATTEQVDDALQLIEQFGERPWFVMLAFSAPHGPFHAPPDDLHTFDLPPTVADNAAMHHQAMAEAMDTEIGRLLTTMDAEVLARTYVIVVADNGTPKPVVTAPADPNHGKASPYEGGINVPLLVMGPGVVEGAECAGLVNTTDVFATVMDLCGADGHRGAVDSVSMVPYFANPGQRSLRPWAYAENFGPNSYAPADWQVWKRVIRDERGYKLIQRWEQGATTLVSEELYDLTVDPYEANDLMLSPLSSEAQGALVRLRAYLDEV